MSPSTKYILLLVYIIPLETANRIFKLNRFNFQLVFIIRLNKKNVKFFFDLIIQHPLKIQSFGDLVSIFIFG